MTEESIYAVELSYSEIDTILHSFYEHIKHAPESESEKVIELNAKLRESRCFENITGVQL